MPDGIPDGLRDVLERIDAIAVLDVALISLAIYWLLLLLRGTTAMTVLRGISVLLLGAFVLARIFDLQVVNWMLERTITGLVIAIVIVFQPEIRRALERVGRTGWRFALVPGAQEQTLEQVVRAAMRMARQNHGALIVLERETGLQEVIDTGVEMEADLTSELLGTIFTPNTPLHDGAAVIRDGTVVAAGCTLPLSDAPLPAEYGMRHRAALGITESTDAVVIIVSEERGAVSVASQGRMRPDLDEERLRRQLWRLFNLTPEPTAAEPTSRGAGAARRAS